MQHFLFPPNYSSSSTKKMKFSIKDFFSKCEQIRVTFTLTFTLTEVCPSHLVQKYLTQNLIFCEVSNLSKTHFCGKNNYLITMSFLLQLNLNKNASKIYIRTSLPVKLIYCLLFHILSFL